MEKILAEINAVSGVTGSFICDYRGHVIGNAMPISIGTVMLYSIGTQVTQIFFALEQAGKPTQEIYFTYERVLVLARTIGVTTLIILCDPQIDLALLRLTLNVMMGRIKNNDKLKPYLASNGKREIGQEELDSASREWLVALAGPG